jgi:hypothetical protein
MAVATIDEISDGRAVLGIGAGISGFAELGRSGTGAASCASSVPAWRTDWVVYAKPPMAGPKQVLEYLGRYTHRVAISNNRLLGIDDGAVRFRWKNYRAGGRVETMTLAADESEQPDALSSRPYREYFGRRTGGKGLAAQQCLTVTSADETVARP